MAFTKSDLHINEDYTLMMMNIHVHMVVELVGGIKHTRIKQDASLIYHAVKNVVVVYNF